MNFAALPDIFNLLCLLGKSQPVANCFFRHSRPPTVLFWIFNVLPGLFEPLLHFPDFLSRSFGLLCANKQYHRKKELALWIFPFIPLDRMEHFLPERAPGHNSWPPVFCRYFQPCNRQAYRAVRETAFPAPRIFHRMLLSFLQPCPPHLLLFFQHPALVFSTVCITSSRPAYFSSNLLS